MDTELEKMKNSPFSRLCDNCNTTTAHTVIHEVRWDEPNEDITYIDYCQMTKCEACGHPGYRIVNVNDGNIHDDEDRHGLYCIPDLFFFQRNAESQIKASDILNTHDLPNEIRKMYEEVISSIQSGNFMLSGVGLRTIIEAVMVSLGSNGWSLSKKIDEAVGAGKITELDADRLRNVKFLGDSIAHRMAQPTQPEVASALRLCNHLLQSTFLLHRDAAILASYNRNIRAKD